MKYFQRFLLIFIQLKWILCDFDASGYNDRIATKSVEDWLIKVNEQYYTLSHYAAVYTWEIGVNGNKDLQNEATELGKIRLHWKNQRCDESEDILDDLTDNQRRMVWMLCRGPKYNNDEVIELSIILDKIQAIYTETEICLPKTFDLCLNYHRIWDYTYVTDENGDVSKLNFSVYRSECCLDSNHLHFYNGNICNDYYVYRGKTNKNQLREESEIENQIRNSSRICFNIESDLEEIMQGNFQKFNREDCALPAELIFRWTWEAWRLAVGPKIKKYYPQAIKIMNYGAQKNGYNNIGETWREELEIDNIRDVIKKLWLKIKPFYINLHGVLRNALWKKYFFENMNILTRTGPIPAHILGNMWSSDWSSYEKLLLPFEELRLEDQISKTNWTTLDMVKRADDFYRSLGLNPVTKTFWNNSIFEKTSNRTKCHGSAGNMFKDDDYRMVICVNRSIYGFYEIIHEMGHIQYYMHLKYQPPLFQDAVNSAVGEAIGDSMFLAMMTPQNLNRLRLIPDNYLAPKGLSAISFNELKVVHETKPNKNFFQSPSNNEIKSLLKNRTVSNSTKQLHTNWLTAHDHSTLNYRILLEKFNNFANMKERTALINVNRFDIALLLKLALMKIPQIPFEYILDLYRWDLFSGDINDANANDKFWEFIFKEQGIHPPYWNKRHNLFDAAAKFHFADNTPYVRYFLASILQVQIFKGLCEYTVFGKFQSGQKLPMPLHRCDIYGSRRAGRILKKAMKLGSSVHWSEVLYILTGNSELSADPLLEYYQPLIIWLDRLIINFEIPIGWGNKMKLEEFINYTD
ncbi:angiotensin-converting enzyme-like protein Ace3 [Condylostylus longicornis]|uniref:angiotensin-converting enzyme-like protein Ace3 n=1 Tax=Condylostylus longicornis TaxID=2530218 RepID=UPI00244E15BA|nr:angiotensin-converting enzyme-like protein Ace3 [Condylostylus longicornis]